VKALIYRGSADVSLEDMPDPVAGHAREVVMRVAAVGLCGSDIGALQSPGAVYRTGLPFGHEFCGYLPSSDVLHVVNPMVGCNQCRYCSAGDTHLCHQRQIIGIHRAGGFAEKVCVPHENIHAAPDLTPEQGVMVEPLANAVHAWNRAGKPRGRLLVVGAGSIGISLIHLFDSMDGCEVTVVDPNPDRLAYARTMGAATTAHVLADDAEFDAAFDAAGTEQTRALCVRHVRRGGHVSLVGLHDDVIRLSALALSVGDISVHGCFAYSVHEFREAMILARTLRCDAIDFFPLNDSAREIGARVQGQSKARGFKLAFHA
jgi:threonine dehydrogenase-like Zn-dependent dehydrogenase